MTHPLYSPRPQHALLGALAVGCVLLVACGKSPGTTFPPPEPPPNTDLEFAYPARVMLTERGVPMAPQAPTILGTGTITDWTLVGELPAGVAFNAVDGTISGTPTDLASPRSLEVTASGPEGDFTQRLSLSASGVTRFGYSANDGDNTLGQFTAEDASGSPSPRTFEHSGYALQTPGEVSPQDVQADPQGRVVYSLNQFSITPYLVDAQSGALTAGTPVSLGTGPHSLYVHPSGEYIYVASSPADRLRAYAVDAVLGQLSLIEQVTTGPGPTDIAGDPNGRYLVVGHETGEVLHSFLIDAGTGGMTLAGTTDLLTVITPDIEMGPLGENLYVVLTAPFEGTLRCSIDTATAVVTLGPTGLTGSAPRAMTVEPGRRFAYVLNQGSADISYYSIADDNGKLTKLGELPSTTGTVSLRFTRDGECAVAIDELLDLARTYELEADGTLTQTGSFRLRDQPQAMAFIDGAAALTRTTDVMYVLNSQSDDITVLRVDSQTGLVTDGGLPAVPTGASPSDLALDPLHRFAFVSNAGAETITVYTMQPNGDLIDNLTPFDVAGSTPTNLTVTPNGDFLYAALGGFDMIAMYAISTDGSLSLTGTRPTDLPSDSLEIEPNGRYLYAVRGGNGTTDTGSVRVFSIDASTGDLTQLSPLVTAAGYPTKLTFAAGGLRAYSPQRDLNLGQPWNMNQNGFLTPVLGGTVTQTEPVDIALTPNETFAFVTCFDAAGLGSLLTFDVDQADGRLFNSTTSGTTWRSSISSGTNPVAVEVSRDGRFVYVLSQISEDLRVYELDQASAVLTEVQQLTRGLLPIKLVQRVSSL